jgi:hypothetical protein
LHAFAVARNGEQYYICANRFSIVRAGKKGEENFLTHHTFVRDLALDDQDNLYFSEASGGGADGKIYRIHLRKGDHMPRAELFCSISLRDVGYWAGDFAFGRTDKGKLDLDTLYLSSGNSIPSSIFRIKRKGKEWYKPEPVFQADMSISGLVLTSPSEVYFVSGN